MFSSSIVLIREVAWHHVASLKRHQGTVFCTGNSVTWSNLSFAVYGPVIKHVYRTTPNVYNVLSGRASYLLLYRLLLFALVSLLPIVQPDLEMIEPTCFDDARV